MAQHPEIARLSPEQVREMLEQSMVDRGLKEPTTMGKAWKYGMQLYNVWSYGAWGYSMSDTSNTRSNLRTRMVLPVAHFALSLSRFHRYKDQTVLRLVAAGVIKAATWTMVFLI